MAALPRSLFAKGPRVCPSRENEKGGGDDRRVREREGCRIIWNGEPKKYRVNRPHNMREHTHMTSYVGGGGGHQKAEEVIGEFYSVNQLPNTDKGGRGSKSKYLKILRTLYICVWFPRRRRGPWPRRGAPPARRTSSSRTAPPHSTSITCEFVFEGVCEGSFLG